MILLSTILSTLMAAYQQNKQDRIRYRCQGGLKSITQRFLKSCIVLLCSNMTCKYDDMHGVMHDDAMYDVMHDVLLYNPPPSESVVKEGASTPLAAPQFGNSL